MDATFKDPIAIPPVDPSSSMKTQYIIPILILSAFLPALSAENIEVDSSITNIALFRDGALVTREGSITAPAGKSALRFHALPTRVDRSALQANFIGTANGLIRNAKIFIPEDRDESDAVNAIREKLEDTNADKDLLLRKRSEANASIEFAQEMRRSFAKEYGKIDEGETLTLDQAKELAAFVAQTQVEAFKTIDSVETEIKAIDERIEDLKKELQKAIETDQNLSSVAEVEIEMAEAGEIGIALSYLANAAQWTPQYELRARPNQKQIGFGYFASIWQQTGEDWSDVTLSLHTNRANRQGNVPVLPPLALQNRQVYPKGSFSSRSAQFSEPPPAAQAELALSNMAIDARGQIQEVAVSSSTVSFQATIPGKIAVPSARDASAFKVLESNIEAEFWSEAVPKIQLDTYLRAKIVNTLDLPILPGQALAFVDGKLSSKVFLDKILPEEETELSLGTDANIIVKRREGSQKDTDSGFIDKTTTLTRSYANEVTNYHAVDHKVIIVDQFPIAQNAKIEIRRQTPKENEVTIEDENNGLFKWEATLKPKEERTFTTSFEVIYPRDWSLYPEL